MEQKPKPYPKLIPSKDEIEVAALVQRAQRYSLSRRVNDNPETVMFDDGYGRTYGFDEPVPMWKRSVRRARANLPYFLYSMRRWGTRVATLLFVIVLLMVSGMWLSEAWR